MSRTRLLVAGTTLGASLALAACSSSGSAIHAGGGTAGRPPAGGSTSAVHPHPNSSQPTTPGLGTGAGWCGELAHAGDAIVALGGSSTESPSAYKAKLARLVGDAPGDIKPDLQVLEKIDDRVADGDTKAEDEISSPTTTAHVRRVAAWLSKNCPELASDLPSGLH